MSPVCRFHFWFKIKSLTANGFFFVFFIIVFSRCTIFWPDRSPSYWELVVFFNWRWRHWCYGRRIRSTLNVIIMEYDVRARALVQCTQYSTEYRHLKNTSSSQPVAHAWVELRFYASIFFSYESLYTLIYCFYELCFSIFKL